MEENKIVAVIYIDGSAGPTNPGQYASGSHGYIYMENNPSKKTVSKPNKNKITTSGYIGEDIFKAEEYIVINPISYFDAIFGYSGIGTNNMAEVLAMIESYNTITTQYTTKVNKFIFKTDSMYLINVVNKIRAIGPKWRDDNRPNMNLWEILENLLNSAIENNIEIIIDKVLGHSGLLGNHLADRLAYLARYKASLNIPETVYHFTDSKDYWTVNNNRHAFLRFKQLFFVNTLRTKQPEIVYHIMNYAKDVEIGKKSNIALFGLVVLKERQDVIEQVINAYQHNLGSLSLVATVDLNVAYTHMNVMYQKLFGNYIYSPSNKIKTIMSMLEEDPIAYSVVPSGLAVQAIERMDNLYIILNRYRENIKHSDYINIDITDQVYNIEKDKYSVLLSNGASVMYIQVDAYNKNLNIPIELGKECIDRNQFKAIEKEIPKVTIVIHAATELCFYYYIIVECVKSGDISVWCNFYTNKLLFKAKK